MIIEQGIITFDVAMLRCSLLSEWIHFCLIVSLFVRMRLVTELTKYKV